MANHPSSVLEKSCTAFENEPYTVETFIDDVKAAARIKDVEEKVLAIKRALVSAVKDHPGFLPERFKKPSSCGTYARRPLYIDPYGRFSILVMVWDRGQGTPLHDHGGEWVVECLYEGRMKVTDFDLEGEANGLYKFRSGHTEHARAGEASHRIPPAEHHILENDRDTPSVTIHVFGGLMQRCDIFERVDGGYRRVPKDLVYTA